MAHSAQSVRRRPGKRPPRGEAKCGWNTPSFGALLGLERAAALAKTCFCQQKPHFTDTQQKTVMGRKPLRLRSPAAAGGELESLASSTSTPGLNKWARTPAHHFVNAAVSLPFKDCLPTVGWGELWEHFPLRGLSVPDAIKPYALLSAPGGSPDTAPSRHAHRPSSHTVPSQVFSCQENHRRLFHCRMGVHFHYYKTGSTPFSPVQEQAAKLFFGLQFVQMQNEGGGQACYRGDSRGD